jgi:ABC-type oligopeptide transport system substrate-binding subunit
MSDIDISYALASCLVAQGSEGKIVSGLAASWKVNPQTHSIDFKLRPDGKWSDGTNFTATDVLKSFADTKAHFHTQIPSLFESYISLEAVSDSEVRFVLKPGIKVEQFLLKLIEPMHGIVRASNGKQNTAVTTGAYFLSSGTDKEVVLAANPYWYGANDQMFTEVRLKRPGKTVSAETLLNDPWPDMISIPSFLTRSEFTKLSKSVNVWRRNLDRVVTLNPTNSSKLERTRKLISYWRAHAPMNKVSESIAFGVFADQIYPAGLILHSKKKLSNSPPTKGEILAQFGKQEITIAYAKDRMPIEVLESFDKNVCSVLPIKCKLVPIDIKDISGIRANGTYDFYFGGLGIDVINLDGGLSYYFELKPPPIPSDGSASGNFIARLKSIREQDKIHALEKYRELMLDVVEGNYVLPLAHSSTVVVGREYIDFESIPPVYETVPFGLIKWKKK